MSPQIKRYLPSDKAKKYEYRRVDGGKKAVLCRIQRVFRRAVAPELYRRCAEPAAGIVNDEDYTEYEIVEVQLNTK